MLQQHSAAVASSQASDTDSDSLSSGYSRPFVVFIALLIISTSGLLIYSNTQPGAYVQVQVTPQLPSTDDVYTSNMSPRSAFSLSNTDTIDSSLSMHEWLSIVDNLKQSHRHFQLTNATHSAALHTIPDIDLHKTYTFDVFSFTLTSSVTDFWNAKAYSLSFVIACFSGAWPHIKLVMLLFIWLQPVQFDKRKRVLLMLDQLGKYSFVDLYVCVFMIVSFFLTITKQLPSGLGIEVAVVVEIDRGVTTFAGVTLASMLYSMLFIYLDEQKRTQRRKLQSIDAYVVDNKADTDKPDMGMLDVDCFEHEIERYSKLDGWKEDRSCRAYTAQAKPKSFMGVVWRCLFLVLIIGNIWLCIDTIYTAPVRYNMKGLAGWAIDDNVRDSSIKVTADMLPKSTDMVASALSCVVQYYMTVIIAPIVISVVLVVVWLCPMSYRMHNRLCHLLLPLQAWNALDVFMIGTLAASVELDEVSLWILNTNFESVCGDGGTIQRLFHTGCFEVKGHLTYGMVMLVTFVVFQWFALLYTRKHMKQTHKQWATVDFQPVNM